VNTLKKDWKSTYGIQHILVTVKCLLIYPNPESALDEEAGKMFMEDYKSYCSRAKLITSVHATPRSKPVEFETPSAEEQETSTKPSATETVENPTSSKAASTSSPPSSTPASSRPPTSRKAGSPGPQQGLGLKSAPSVEKALKQDRHPSPSPLGTADANVAAGKQAGVGLGMGMAPGSAGVSNAGGSKAVKRSATGSAPSNAEKRKKALKRL
jgi:ubiquitin-conjugating enzyme E2 S